MRSLLILAVVALSTCGPAPPADPPPEAYWIKRMCEMPRYWHLRQCRPYLPPIARQMIEGNDREAHPAG